MHCTDMSLLWNEWNSVWRFPELTVTWAWQSSLLAPSCPAQHHQPSLRVQNSIKILSKFSRCFNSMHCVREQDINKLLFNAQGPFLLLIFMQTFQALIHPSPRQMYIVIFQTHPYRIFITLASYIFNISLFVLGGFKEIACSSTTLS